MTAPKSTRETCVPEELWLTPMPRADSPANHLVVVTTYDGSAQMQTEHAPDAICYVPKFRLDTAMIEMGWDGPYNLDDLLAAVRGTIAGGLASARDLDAARTLLDSAHAAGRAEGAREERERTIAWLLDLAIVSDSAKDIDAADTMRSLVGSLRARPDSGAKGGERG